MKQCAWFLCLFLGALAAQAQPFETQRRQVPIVVPLEKAPEIQQKGSLLSLPLTSKNGENNWMKLPEKQIDFTGKSNLVHRKIEFKPNYQALNDHQKEDYEAPKGNQFFGDFANNGQFVNVYCRDFAAIDGDRVSIYVNEQEQVRDIFLLGEFRGFKIELKQGFNKIEFLALNQGESGPNTAEFMVLDDKGNTIARNVWNLATGSKAQFVIVKDH